jgi:hypothetical protein
MTELINQQNKLVAMAISFYLRLLFFEQLYRDRNRNFVMKSLVKGLESYYPKIGSTSTGRGKLVARKLVAATWTRDNWTHATIGRDENWTRENNYNM